jgi:hypothetical protein
MEYIPPPLELHHGREGFKHATSGNILDWETFRVSTRENRITALKDQEPMIDTHNRKRVTWEKNLISLQPITYQSPRTDLLSDPSEVTAILNRIG